jgi:polyisoprenoid-binding protein YceI
MTSEATMVRYRLMPEGGHFTVQAKAAGMLSFLGHNPSFAIRDFTGELACDPVTWAAGECWLAAQASSLELLNRVSDADRAEIEGRARRVVLQVDRFPEIKFVAEVVGSEPVGADGHRMHLRGRLSLRGATRPLELPLYLTLLEGWIGLAGDFEVRPSDYGIAPVTALGGALRLEDRLKLSVAIAGQKVEPQEDG